MGRKTNQAKTVPLEVTFTEGYQERFTKAILKIYEKRMKENRIEDLKTDRKLKETREEEQRQEKAAV